MSLDEAIEREEALAYSFGERWKRLGEPIGDLPKLEQEHRQMAEWLRELKAYKEQQPYEDCISRQAAIDAITKIHPVDSEYDCTLYDKIDVMYVLKDLPSVTQRPKGKWIYEMQTMNNPYTYKCSVCKGWEKDKTKYCPNCGAEMSGGEEE